MIRKAKVSEAWIIQNFLEDSKQHGVLPRTMAYIYSHIHDYVVADDFESAYIRECNRSIVGVASLHVCWDEVAELRSLVVKEEFRAERIGTNLVLNCLNWAKELELRRVFLLCLIPKYFKKFGFKEISRADLPPVAWADCVGCLKFPDCDEIPMILEL